MLRIFFSLLFLTLFVACLEKDRAAEAEIPITTSNLNFQRELPINYGADVDDITHVAADLGLDNLDNGYKSGQVRLWFVHSMGRVRQVLILKKLESGWCSEVIKFNTLSESGKDQLRANVVEKKVDVYPKSGWKALLSDERIQKAFGFLQTSNLDTHTGCGGTDGMTYTFEIATQKVYRLLYYCELEGSLQRFVDRLASEFEISYLK